MVEIQLLFEGEGNRRALSSVVDEHYTPVVDEVLRNCDLYLVDEAAFPKYRDALKEQKHEQQPVFCPVVLVRRERAAINVSIPDPVENDPPLLVNAVVEAPIKKQTLFRAFTNLLSRRDQSEALTDELRDRNERLEQFASTLRHELRNPLNVLDGYLDRARDQNADEAFDVCQEATDQMKQLLEDTLLIIEGDDVDTDPEPVDLSAVCDGSWDVVSARSADLEIDASKQILADEVRLKQLLENLFRNAVEHAGPNVTVTVGDTGDGFYVEDDGPGIPEDERESVFEEGYSGSSAGTGIGLAVVRAVADGHGWCVRITESGEGGARFEIADVVRYPATDWE